MNEQELQQIELRARRTEVEVRELSKRDGCLRMSIPVQDTDGDMVIGETVEDVRKLVAEVRGIRSQMEEASTFVNGLLEVVHLLLPLAPEDVQAQIAEIGEKLDRMMKASSK